MKKRRKAGGSMDGDVTPHASDKESEGEGLPKFDFPMFGNSPGPSPIPTPPPHPATPEIEEVPEVSSQSYLSFYDIACLKHHIGTPDSVNQALNLIHELRIIYYYNLLHVKQHTLHDFNQIY